MKKSISNIISILIAIIIFFISIFLYQRQQTVLIVSPIVPSIPQDTLIVSTKRTYDPTNTTIITRDYDVRGVSMEPMIHNGDTVTIDLNYYNSGQHIVTAGDIVVFENPFTLNRIIKKVVIVPGDKVVKDLKNKTLLVNDRVLKNSVGESYIFDDRAYRWIDIYTKSGAIMENTYFLYGDNINASLDSRKTGPVSLEGILGKEVSIKSPSRER